jgi:large subunit ribosomal protein L7/L12
MLTGVQTSFVDIVLLQTGKKRTDVIMALREVTFKESLLTPLDLGTASRLVDNTPCVIQLSIPLDVAERVKTRLEKVGASIELKPA